jgi:predicted nucleotidyltransferase
MRKTEEMLASTLAERLKVSGRAAQEYFNEAAEVIVFGSMSAGLDRPTSDMDVLCMGTHDRKFKSDLLDLIVVPSVVTKTRSWRQSELATHVACYGTWIKGKPSWTSDIGVGEHAVKEKRRRILAFISALHGSWFRLEECFHVKYSIKLRREIQRLLLLERDVPVPPTIILDSSWTPPGFWF